MVHLRTGIAFASLLACATLVLCAPAGSITASPPSEIATVSPAGNEALQRENADLLAPPTIDHGTVSSFKWPFSLSHDRLQTGGWARQQNTDDMPAATGQDLQASICALKLAPFANFIDTRLRRSFEIRQWAYVLKGKIQVTSIDTEGPNYLATVQQSSRFSFTDRFQDISLNQWLALTPPALVKAHLGLSDDIIAKLSKTKPVIIGPGNSTNGPAF
ncbi:hypothetical protein PUNSTDRAFT_139024 [Punctularia strigosozonata HHB-11173 SS5]|uniref:Uncharacterized protein n=1 Tax=Punctularia strigosozonata (strain HHB-11173) TaxID=741275 RepID=R7S2Q0_PUNST|nr:uncharacterized protein PUNSTDRAFT_139024 [Punctularia strigosozonata HHB-11173 SS5]EIN04067.1 hypothetical protein PUNSTDRAFT_139024 [Punctularia strigosozonata HHB-11173 SS5]